MSLVGENLMVEDVQAFDINGDEIIPAICANVNDINGVEISDLPNIN